MSRNISRWIAAAIVIFVGCQTGIGTFGAVKVDGPVSLAKVLARPSDSKPGRRKIRTAFHLTTAKKAAMPRVLLSKQDQAACKVGVGDVMPAIELPKLDGTGRAKLADLFGKKGTVVVFWKSDRRMSQQQLSDIGADVVEPFGKQGVAVIGVAVDESAPDAETAFKKTGASFTNLHDADGKAFALVGSGRFPRTYVLDPGGKIVWFDIEYSLATRRELRQVLRTITGGK